MDLQTRKAHLVEYLLGLQDEATFKRIEDSINKTRHATTKPLRQLSPQELIDRARKSNEDYRSGKFINQEQLEKESNKW
jgi:predicted transcriptional regulator